MLIRFPLPNAMTEAMSGPRSSGTRRTGTGFATAVWLACLFLAALPGQGLAASSDPSSSSQPSAQSSALSDALVLHAKLDFGAAFGLLLPLAEKGDAVAQEVVGFMYAHGETVPLNRRAAFEWLTRAAENGRTEAQIELAHCYREGLGTPPNDGLALFWLERAAAQGSPQAMNAIGEFYLEFATVPADFRSALGWFLIAAENRSWQAMLNISIQYQLGLGVESDDIEAFKWIELAAREGGPFGEAGLVRHEWTERLMPAQIQWASSRAQQWLREHELHPVGLVSVVAFARKLRTR
jgi:TPR repeat protein